MSESHELVALNVQGLAQRLSIHIHGSQDLHVSAALRQQGIWEPYESSLVLKLLQPGDVFVDCLLYTSPSPRDA